MKVILISVPGIDENDSRLFPLGLGYLIGSLKHAHEVMGYHFSNMTIARKEIHGKIDSFKPDVVGLTCNTFNRGSVKRIIKQIRSIDKKIKIVVGGIHASFCYDQMLEQYGADIVVIGEGEKTFPELCSVLEQDGFLKSVKGIAYKENKKVVLTPRRESVNNLDELPVPDYSYAQSFMEKIGMGFIITSRGCPVRCTFCSTSSFWGQKVRMNSPVRVVDEMEMLIARFRIKKIFFDDDTFNLGVERVKAICREIKNRKINVEWACSCRVNPVTEEMISCMVDAGCRHICWGIESGSEIMLKRIGKKITLSQISNAFELSSKFSNVMSTGAFTMVGNPGESTKTIQDTVNFLNTIPITDRPSTSILYILPGTLLYGDLKGKGCVGDEDWFKRDSIPIYTLENSFKTLARWAGMVNSSGKRIPFDTRKHFWYGIIETFNLNQDEVSPFSNTREKFIGGIAMVIRIVVRKFLRVLKNPQKIISKIKNYFPAKKCLTWQ